MKVGLNFESTEPAVPKKYEEPVQLTRRAKLIFAGASENGSHAVRTMGGCARSYALHTPNAVLRPPRASQRTGVVTVLVDDGARVLVEGPVQPAQAVGAGGASVYMVRGTFAHIALAHAFARAALERGETFVVGGNHVSGSPDEWYTPAEAVEAASTLIGMPSFTFALPAARRLLPALTRWVQDTMELERVIAIETQLVWHLLAPFAYTARIDIVTQSRASGLYYATDYKTSANPTADKRRYTVSAQFIGQDQMGRRWAGAKWGGVRVALIPDRGDGVTAPLSLWAWPRSPRSGDFEAAVADTQARVEPYFGKPAHQWPANPLHCSGCGAAARAACFAG